MSTFPGAFVPVAPPADGLQLAFVAARRRRTRKAGATGAAGLLAAVALIASTGGAGERTLMQEPLPPSSTSGLGLVTAVDEPPAGQHSTAAPPATTAAPDATAPRAAGVAVAVRPDPVQDSAPSSSDAGVRAPKAKPVSGPMSRSTGFFYTGGDLMCPARKQQEQQRGLCTDVFASSTGTGTMNITAEVCNVGTNPEFLSYDTARETDVSVQRAGIDVWRWSLGRSFAETPHNLAVGAQQCVRWTTQWSVVDSHGVKLKAGTYQVVADMAADQVAGPDRHPSSTFTVS